MSKNFKGYMGDQIGKLGTAVGRRWKGMMIYSAYQGKVANPKTSAQQLVRERFAILGNMSSQFLPAIGISLKPAADRAKSTQTGEFVKLNQEAVTGTLGSLNIVPEAVKLCKGSLTKVTFGTPNYSTPLTVSVPVTANNVKSYSAQPDDKIYLAVYSGDAGEVAVSAGVDRGTEETPAASVSVAVPPTMQGMEVHVYAFVVNAQTTKVSNSVYLGSGEIA